MENIYVKLGWPEYQAYQQFDDFDEHAHYCAEDDICFIEQQWLMERDAKESAKPDASTSFKYNDMTIELSSRYVGTDAPAWDSKRQHHHHIVTVKIGRKSHSFDFWSGMGCYRNTTNMSEKDMIEAFESFLSECIAADQSIDDFQSEYGYEKASECIRVYNACKESLEAWKDFFIDPYDLDNWLRVTYDV